MLAEEKLESFPVTAADALEMLHEALYSLDDSPRRVGHPFSMLPTAAIQPDSNALPERARIFKATEDRPSG